MSEVNAGGAAGTNGGAGTGAAGASGGAPAGVSNTGTAAANAGANGGAGSSTSGSEWKTGFNDDLRGYVDNKGFKGPQDLAEAYRNFEKLQGVPQDRILKLSEKMYDDKGVPTAEARSIYERLGMPKEAKDYNINVPKEFGDEKLANRFREIFHEQGISKTAAEKIVENWNQYNNTARQEATEAAKIKFNQDVEKLKTEWGPAHDQNMQLAKQGMLALGLTDTEVNAISGLKGHAETVKLLKSIGAKVGEGSFVRGSNDANQGIMEPTSAQAKIKELSKDADFGRRLMANDAEAKAKWENLHKQAYPGQVNF